MVFSMVGSLPLAASAQQAENNAVAVEDIINICHKTGSNWKFKTVNESSSLSAHLGHGDFAYEGSLEAEFDKDAWCESNIPETTPTDVCPNVDGVQTQNPCADTTCEEEGGTWDSETQECDNPTSQIENSCPAPDSLTDETVEVINAGSEETLQSILNDEGYGVNVNTNQKQYQLWNIPANSEINFDAKFIEGISGSQMTFGYYTDSSMANFVPVFKTGASAPEAVPVVSSGSPAISVNVGAATSVGFAIKVYHSTGPLLGIIATENALYSPAENGPTDKAIVYSPASDQYVIAFEDWEFGGFDYNDVVVEITLECEEVQGETTSSNITYVDPVSMNGWTYFPENNNGGQTGQMVVGPTGQPAGTGSAEFKLTANDQGQVLGMTNIRGTRFSQINSLTYSTYTPTAGVALPALQFEFDNNRSDADNSYKGRLVYEPYYTHTVSTNTWQTWNPMDNSESGGNGNWWFSDGTIATASGCSITTPCTWAEITALYPNAGIRDDGTPLSGLTLFKAGSGSTFTANVDKFITVIKTGNNTHTETYDFEPSTTDTPTPSACSDGIDNSDAEDSLADALDPGCHSDGNVNNTNSYVSSDNDESNSSTQCSDGLDNDTDGNIDSQDVGCQSGEGNSWNPDDDNEINEGNNNSSGSSSSGSSRRTGSSVAGQVLGAETSCGIYLDKYLKMGLKNDVEAVKKVQKFLNDFFKAGLVVDGVFGPLTDKHVRAFQLSHKTKILDPWGLKGPTGIVYLTTQTEINNIICPPLDLPIPPLTPFETNPAVPPKA